MLDSMEAARLYGGNHDPSEVVTERIVREVPAAMPASSNAMRDERTPLPAPPRRRDTVVLTENASTVTRRITVRGNTAIDGDYFREYTGKKLKLSICCTRCGHYNMIGTHFCDSCWLFRKGHDTPTSRKWNHDLQEINAVMGFQRRQATRGEAWRRDSCTSLSSPSSIIAGQEKWGTGASSTVTRLT